MILFSSRQFIKHITQLLIKQHYFTGKGPRQYCKNCGTMLFNVYEKNWCAVNRNALTKSDGEAYYVPPGKVTNVNCKYAFEPDKIKAPKSKLVPFGTLLKLITLLTGFGCDGSNTEESLIPDDIAKVEVSPITW